MTTPADVLKMIKEKEVKFVDFRFTDTRGKEQHVSVPQKVVHDGQVRVRPRVRRLVDRGMERHPGLGHAADARRQHGLHRSVHGRDDAQHQLRRGRAVGRQGLRARSALARPSRGGLSQVHGAWRHRLFRPGAGILHLRRRRVVGRHVGQLLQDLLIRGRVVVRRKIRGRQHGSSADREGRLFSGPAGRFAAGHPLGDLSRAGADGRGSRGAPSRSRERWAVRDRHQVRAAGPARRLAADPEVRGAQHGARVRQDGDVHAEADRRRQRIRHALPPVDLQGRQEPVCRRRLRRSVRDRALLHRRHHQAREGAERDHEPGHELVQAARSGLRGADQSRLFGAQSLGGDPHSVRRPIRRDAASKCASPIRRQIRISRSRRC